MSEPPKNAMVPKVFQPEIVPAKKPLEGDFGVESALTREQNISKLFTEEDLPRKIEVPIPKGAQGWASTQLLVFHNSSLEDKKKMVPPGTIRHKIPNIGDYGRAFVYFMSNASISHGRYARLEFVQVAKGMVMETEDGKRRRALEGLVGF